MAASEGWGDDNAASSLAAWSIEDAFGPAYDPARITTARKGHLASRQQKITKHCGSLPPFDDKAESVWSPAASMSMASPLRSRHGPPGRVASLQGLCLGCLGEYIEELLSCGVEAVAMLTAEQKAAMGAIARRRGLLYGDTLEALADPQWVSLDLAGCSRLDDDTLIRVLQMLDRLQALDLSRCDLVTPAALQQLPKLCPLLKQLRLGGSQASSAAGSRALKKIVPKIQYLEEDSWEDVLDAELGTGLVDLQQLLWPDMPYSQRRYMEQHCAKVEVHWREEMLDVGGAAATEEPRMIPWPALDLPLADAVGPAAWRVLHQQADALRPKPVHIAEKFRRAYDERNARASAKAERNRRQWIRRQAQQNGSDGKAESSWLDGDGSVLT